MKAVISNFRKGMHHQTMNHIILVVDGLDSREKAGSMVGKEVVWKSSAGTEIKGKVASPHGNKGAIRAIFERGLPGQAIGEPVDIL